MGQSKPAITTTHDSKALLADKPTLRYYADRDIKDTQIQAFLTDCLQFQALLTAAGNKTVL